MSGMQLKTLREDGRDLLLDVRYPLPTDGEAAAWVSVPDPGCRVTSAGGELFPCGVVGDVLAEMDCEEALDADAAASGKGTFFDPDKHRGVLPPSKKGISRWRRVRVKRVIPWSKMPLVWHWVTRVVMSSRLSEREKCEMILDTDFRNNDSVVYALLIDCDIPRESKFAIAKAKLSLDQTADGYHRWALAADVSIGFTPEQRWEIVSAINPVCYNGRYMAARHCDLSPDRRRRLIAEAVYPPGLEFVREARLALLGLQQNDLEGA